MHANCAYSRGFELEKMKDLFKKKKLISFSDEEVEYLWHILLQGL